MKSMLGPTTFIHHAHFSSYNCRMAKLDKEQMDSLEALFTTSIKPLRDDINRLDCSMQPLRDDINRLDRTMGAMVEMACRSVVREHRVHHPTIDTYVLCPPDHTIACGTS